MKVVLIALAAVSTLVAADVSRFTIDSVDKPHAGYIIELEAPVVNSKRTTHSIFHARAENLAANYSVRHEFTNTEYFHGISVDASEEDATLLAALPEVKNIWPNKVHARPRPFHPAPYNTSSTSQETRLPSREERIYSKNVTVVHVTGDSDINASLKMTGVDKVHKLGFTGKGVKVAVIDSGIDYRHPALGGGFGKGFKIAGGYDLVGEDYTGYNTPVPDDDPLVTCLEGGHGTHVAGIIGAQDPKGVGFGVLGVAPDASLYIYRIFSCEGSAADDIIMQGFEKAASDGVDVISMSVGYSNLWEANSPYTPLMEGLLKKGIGLVIAAGNDGERGPYFASTPALSPAAISVGSVANTKFTSIYHAEDSTGQTVRFSRMVSIKDTENKFHVFTVPGEDVSCTIDDWTKASQQFSDKKRLIALLSAKSLCQWELKELAESTGIEEIWLEAREGEDLRQEEPIPWAGFRRLELPSAEAKKIRAGLGEQGANYTLTFKDQSVHDIDQPNGGTMNLFSTFGPTMEMSLKPQISGPGGNILSTWPVTDGIGYALISGTSMATPFISGVYALLKSSDRRLTPQDIRTRLQNSANPLPHKKQGDLLSSTAHQGAGLVNAFNAIKHGETVVTPAEINFRDSSKPVTQIITVKNRSKTAKVYTLDHKGAGMVEALPQIFSSNHNDKFRWALGYLKSYATANFSSKTIKIAAGSQAKVKVTISPPTKFDVNKLPIYSGYVTIKSNVNENFEIPYIGIPYQRGGVPVLDTTNLTDPGYWSPSPPEGVPVVPLMVSADEGRNNDIDTYTFADFGGPSIYLSVRQPSASVRLDVVPVDTPFQPDFYGFKASKRHTNSTNIVNYVNSTGPTLDLLTLDNLFNVSSYGAISVLLGDMSMPKAGSLGRLWRGYGAFSQTWETPEVTLNNGTSYTLPNGDYRILLRVLKWGHDWRNSESYMSWLSPIARIEYIPQPEDPEEES